MNAAPPYWCLLPSMAAMEEVSRLMDSKPPAYDVKRPPGLTPAQEAFVRSNVPDPETGLIKPIPAELGLPRVKLVIANPTFRQEYVEQSGIFCSARLRELFGLRPETVQYSPVDDSLCPPEVRALDYQAMNLLSFRSVIDLERSQVMRLPIDHMGNPGPERVVAVTSVVFKDEPPGDYDLFRELHDSRIYASDAFARRVLEAGIRDVMFIDVSSAGNDPLVAKA